jgi:hypothetical protein
MTMAAQTFVMVETKAVEVKFYYPGPSFFSMLDCVTYSDLDSTFDLYYLQYISMHYIYLCMSVLGYILDAYENIHHDYLVRRKRS